MTTPLGARVRGGFALGAVATGTFATVPGLLLLPYLTDTLGIGALAAGCIMVLPKAWDVVRNPIAGRVSDLRASRPAGRRPFLLWSGVALGCCFALLFAGPGAPPMLNSTLQSTKSGGPLAAAWAVVRHIGDDGYAELARSAPDGVDRLVDGLTATEHVSLVAEPDSTLRAVEADDACDVFTISDAMLDRGW